MDQYNQSYPDYGATEYGQPPQQNTTSRTILIVVGVLLLLCCCCIVFGLLMYYVLGDILTDAMGLTQLLPPLLM
jgi:hypothetical protein